MISKVPDISKDLFMKNVQSFLDELKEDLDIGYYARGAIKGDDGSLAPTMLIMDVMPVGALAMYDIDAGVHMYSHEGELHTNSNRADRCIVDVSHYDYVDLEDLKLNIMNAINIYKLKFLKPPFCMCIPFRSDIYSYGIIMLGRQGE